MLGSVPTDTIWGKEASEKGGPLKVAAIETAHIDSTPSNALLGKEASKEGGPLNNVVEDNPRKRVETKRELDKR
uniref:Uncharacterized protein n=1 Tax=Oryza barthii TaxID=65489 RepID=A0A0D3GRR5_9ORYZ